MEYESMTIDLPDEHTSELWKKLNRRPLRITVSYTLAYKNEKAVTDVFAIYATVTRHRHVKWSESLYTWIGKHVNTIENSRVVAITSHIKIGQA